MSIEVEFVLRVSVNSVDEAERIQEAAYSGLAAELVRLGVLYGQLPLGSGVVPTGTTPPSYSMGSRPVGKRREDHKELKPVENKVGQVAVAPDSDKETVKRPRGIAGRKRMGRV